MNEGKTGYDKQSICDSLLSELVLQEEKRTEYEYSLDVCFYEFFRKILSRKIFILQEEKRTDRQNQIFQEFKKRTARAHNTMDEK